VKAVSDKRNIFVCKDTICGFDCLIETGVHQWLAGAGQIDAPAKFIQA
jgi:hypothetical protein